TATNTEPLPLTLESASLGPPLDSWLAIEVREGKSRARDEKINSDLDLLWSPPADGTFVAAIGNIVHRGGPDYLYHLQVERALPALKAVVAKTSFAIEPGKTNEIKVTLNH